ncbi:MAG: hypothetical protein F4Y26_02825 [Gammaproteobacteria bacterium]|nr:hypothetical protein [Gammaproteobacteria bacterium]
MYGWETRMLLKNCLEGRVLKAKLSRRFGVSWRMIQVWMETAELVGSGRGDAVLPAESGRRVYQGTLAGLVAAGPLSRRQPRGRLKVLTHLCSWSMRSGICRLAQVGAVLFFQPINARHERTSNVLTSNKDVEEWGAVRGDEFTAGALIDRLLHHCHLVNIRGLQLPHARGSRPVYGRTRHEEDPLMNPARACSLLNATARPKAWVLARRNPTSKRALHPRQTQRLGSSPRPTPAGPHVGTLGRHKWEATVAIDTSHPPPEAGLTLPARPQEAVWGWMWCWKEPCALARKAWFAERIATNRVRDRPVHVRRNVCVSGEEERRRAPAPRKGRAMCAYYTHVAHSELAAPAKEVSMATEVSRMWQPKTPHEKSVRRQAGLDPNVGFGAGAARLLAQCRAPPSAVFVLYSFGSVPASTVPCALKIESTRRVPPVVILARTLSWSWHDTFDDSTG